MKHVVATFLSLFQLLSVFVVLLNAVAWFAGALWLLCLGEWSLVFQSVVWWCLSSFLLAIVLIPAMGFLWLGAQTKDAIPAVSVLFMLLTLAALVGAMVVWNEWLIEWFRTRSDTRSLVPAMLLAYGNVMSPLQKFVEEHQRRNPPPELAPLYLLCGVSAGAFASIVVVCTSHDPRPDYASVFLGGAAVGVVAGILQRAQEKAPGL